MSLAVLVAVVAAPVPVAAAAPVAASSTSAPIERADTNSRAWAHVAVDTSQVGEAGPAVRRRVQERADVVLRRAGVMPGRGPEDPTITVVIREQGGADPGWEYRIMVTRGERSEAAAEPQTCALCTETELIDAIEGRLAMVAAEIEAAESASATTTPTPTPRPQPDAAVIDAPPGRGLGGRGKAGIALVVLGGAAIVAGAVLAALPPRPKDDDPTYEVFTQPPGYALLGVGGATLVVGAVLLGLDRARARRGKGKTSKGQARLELRGGALRF